MPLRGGGLTPNGEYHFKFPFLWLFEPLPYLNNISWYWHQCFGWVGKVLPMSWQRRALLLSVKGELKSSEKKELKFPVRTQTALLSWSKKDASLIFPYLVKLLTILKNQINGWAPFWDQFLGSDCISSLTPNEVIPQQMFPTYTKKRNYSWESPRKKGERTRS